MCLRNILQIFTFIYKIYLLICLWSCLNKQTLISAVVMAATVLFLLLINQSILSTVYHLVYEVSENCAYHSLLKPKVTLTSFEVCIYIQVVITQNYI